MKSKFFGIEEFEQFSSSIGFEKVSKRLVSFCVAGQSIAEKRKGLVLERESGKSLLRRDLGFCKQTYGELSLALKASISGAMAGESHLRIAMALAGS